VEETCFLEFVGSCLRGSGVDTCTALAHVTAARNHDDQCLTLIRHLQTNQVRLDGIFLYAQLFSKTSMRYQWCKPILIALGPIFTGVAPALAVIQRLHPEQQNLGKIVVTLRLDCSLFDHAPEQVKSSCPTRRSCPGTRPLDECPIHVCSQENQAVPTQPWECTCSGPSCNFCKVVGQ